MRKRGNCYYIAGNIPRVLADLVQERMDRTGEPESEILNKALAAEFGMSLDTLAKYKTFKGQINKKINRARTGYKKPKDAAGEWLQDIEVGVDHVLLEEELDLNILKNLGKNLDKL